MRLSQNLSVVKIKEVLFVGSFQPEIRQQLLYFIAHRRLEFFWKTRTTWSSLKFSGQLRARLDPNYSKWHLQDGSMHCFFPLTSRLWYFFSGMYTTRKWPTSFDFPLLLFLLFSCFLMFSLFFSCFLIFLLQLLAFYWHLISKISKKAFMRREILTMELSLG